MSEHEQNGNPTEENTESSVEQVKSPEAENNPTAEAVLSLEGAGSSMEKLAELAGQAAPHKPSIYELPAKVQEGFQASSERARAREAEVQSLSPEIKAAAAVELKGEITAAEEARMELKIFSETLENLPAFFQELEALAPSTDLEAEVPADSKKIIESLVRSLELALESDTLRYGPVYQTETADGTELIIRDLEVFKEDGIDHHKAHILIATDRIGKILGMRGADFLQDERKIRGTIATLVRGKGIASALENCFAHTAQRVADSDISGQEWTWQVSNENMGALAGLENDGAQSAAIADKEKEQQRWQKLYGEGGRLGFKLIQTAMESGNFDTYAKKLIPLASRLMRREPGTQTAPERFKESQAVEMLVKKNPVYLASVRIQRGEKGLIARETASPDNKDFNSKRNAILTSQLQTLLEQVK